MIRLLPEKITGEYPDVCPYAFGHEPQTLAVVVGRGPCVNEDLAALGDVEADYFAVNAAGVTLPRVDHWGSIHGALLRRHLDDRLAAGRSEPRVVFGNFIGAPNDSRISKWKVRPYPGSSSLFVTRWALFWGYRRIVLCGVPLDGHDGLLPDGSLTHDPGGYHLYRQGWEQREKDLPLVECVRSMSGWTRERYGTPDDGFLGR